MIKIEAKVGAPSGLPEYFWSIAMSKGES